MTLLPQQGEPKFFQFWQPDDDAVRAEILAGLQSDKPRIAPKYLYDSLGSRLFEAICKLPEYYPTRTEAEILDTYLGEIAGSVGPGCTLIDLGAGNCAKAERLFEALQPVHYVPVDISVDFLREAVERLRRRFPQLPITGVGTDLSSALKLPPDLPRKHRLFFYPGSSIGNFAPREAHALLSRIREATDIEGGLLIGVDLVKERGTLESAYNDAIGVTGAFNLNLLQHVNVLAGTNFEVRDWRHHACFDEAAGRIDMFLVAQRDVSIRWEGGERTFREGEMIHTESSYKYTREGFLEMLDRAGFVPAGTWTDERDWFMVCHARAA